MTESNTDIKSFNTFTQKAIDAAPSLASPAKINLSFISQAFKLRKNLSWSTFIAFMLLFFWVSVIGLILFAGFFGVFGPKLMNWLSAHVTMHQKSLGTDTMAISFAKEVVFYSCGALISLFGIGFVWRFHTGKKKKFFATLPSYGLFFRILWPLTLCTAVFTAIFLAGSMLINSGLVMSYVHLSSGNSSHKSIHFMGYIVQIFAIIEAICYWLIQTLVLYILFKRYKQAKSGEAIVPFFKSFYLSFKPFFKQSLRLLVTIACFYLIVLLPVLAINPLVSGMSVDIVKKVMMGVSLVYLVLVPWIMTTFFNLYFLMFNSIENYKSGLKVQKDEAKVEAEQFVSEPKSKAKPKKAKAYKTTDKKTVTSTAAPKTVDKKRPESKVHAKLKKGSSSKK
jgi:hypothetical protein